MQPAATLMTFAEGRPEDIRRSVDRLVKLVDSIPLEPLGASGKANARQRAEANLQVPLWLVARECFAKDQEVLWPQGELLAKRAAAAAKRQEERAFATTIYGEWSRLDLERSEEMKAEVDLNELLNLAIPKATSKADARQPGAVPPPPLAPAVIPPPTSSLQNVSALWLVAAPVLAPLATAGPNQPTAGVRRGGVPPLTEDQFVQAYDVAMLAAELKLSELSMRAMREASLGGPPIIDNNRRRNGGGIVHVINGTTYLVNGGNGDRVSLDQAILKLVPSGAAKRCRLLRFRLSWLAW